VTDIVLVYVTAPDRATAGQIARHVLEKKLAACANIYDISSMYWWEGEINQGTECVIIFKTLAERTDALESEIKAVHPYTVPFICVIPAFHVNEEYVRWAEDAIRR